METKQNTFDNNFQNDVLYAHDNPIQTLYDHLHGTLEWASYFRRSAVCSVLSQLPERLFRDFILLHDLGKATSFFQEYLLYKKDAGELKNHAAFSALFFLTYECRKGISEQEAPLIMAMFYCIHKHHGDLENIKNAYNYRINDERKDLFKRQWESIDEAALKKLFIQLEMTGWEELFTGDWEELLSDVSSFIRKQSRQYNKERTDHSYYYLTQMLFSLLTDADKSQAGLRNMDLAARPDYHADVPSYIDQFKMNQFKMNQLKMNQFKQIKQPIYPKQPKQSPATGSTLNILRNKALHEAAENVTRSGSLMTLTLPTGMGKTLTSFHAAITLKNHLKESTGKDYRIIYVIPFMSIIDQNAREFEKLLDAQNGSISHNLILKHHHLAELVWISKEKGKELETETGTGSGKINSQNAKLLIEGWNSEVVVTTFHQFFLTLIGYRNAMQRKFNKLSNAIVIIDEIQAVPVKYYKLIGQMLEWYTESMDSKVIAMTATQPYIFAHNKSKELCESHKYFESLSRTRIITDFRRKQTVDEFVDALELNGENSYLFIINTIACGRKMCEKLSQKYPDEEILFLNTLMTPNSRRIAIDRIKKGEYRLVVSTQLVEAGVDIDFDIVYRDFAPLPSLFQSAGRGNREGDPDKTGLIYIITLVDDEKGSRYCDMVYTQSVVDLAITEKVLQLDVYEEVEFIQVIQDYFRQISSEEVKSQADSDRLLQGICEQLYYSDSYEKAAGKAAPISQFVLIEEKGNKYPVFIEENQEAAEFWLEYQRVSDIRITSWEVKAKLQDISRKMSDYIINVGESAFRKYNRPPLDSNGLYYYVAQDELFRYYQSDQGYGVLSNTYFYD